MIFSNILKKKQSEWKDSKQYLKSTTDLKLLPEQVIYVEGSYSIPINKIISRKYDEIYSILKSSRFSTEFVYLPFVAKQLQSPTLLLDVLKYYFPNIDKDMYIRDIPSVLRTDIISHLLFSGFGYGDRISPGFFRHIGKDKENLFVYEYFPFVESSKSSILKQIDYYVSSISETQEVNSQLSVKEQYISFDNKMVGDKGASSTKAKKKYILFGNIEEVDNLNTEEQQEESSPTISFNKNIRLQKKVSADSLFSEEVLKKKNFERKECHCSKDFDLDVDSELTDNYRQRKHYSKELDLISQIKSDIKNLKELGFYELLIKELGSILFEQGANRMFQPSRLLMDEEFRIYLSDFNNMEITMTPLPKTLFILFLRHPEGINLKSLIEYKKELLEIYKLLSYRETYFNMVESVNRICNPLEGSINEKLSRIKEAFLRKMSMDTAKYYIVTGERGMKKKIEIDRSLIDFPDAFNEIELTQIFG
jgi:hypothetical protein